MTNLLTRTYVRASVSSQRIPRFRDLPLLSKLFAGGFLVGGYLATAAPALADGTGCSSSAFQSVAGIIGTLGYVAVGLVSTGSVLVFVWAGCLFIFGHQSSHKNQAMQKVKDACIGLAIAVGAFFLRFVLVKFVGTLAGSQANNTCISTGTSLSTSLGT